MWFIHIFFLYIIKKQKKYCNKNNNVL
jgi:hypothetical protein